MKLKPNLAIRAIEEKGNDPGVLRRVQYTAKNLGLGAGENRIRGGNEPNDTSAIPNLQSSQSMCGR